MRHRDCRFRDVFDSRYTGVLSNPRRLTGACTSRELYELRQMKWRRREFRQRPGFLGRELSFVNRDSRPMWLTIVGLVLICFGLSIPVLGFY